MIFLSLAPLAAILVLKIFSWFLTGKSDYFEQEEKLPDLSNESERAGVYYSSNLESHDPLELRDLPELLEFLNSIHKKT